jgi:hypothetical protein
VRTQPLTVERERIQAMFTIFITVALTAILTAIVTAGFCYRFLRRLQADLISDLISEQQDDLDTLQADLIKWVEHECKYHKAPAVENALKQRIKERLSVLDQLQKRREELAR